MASPTFIVVIGTSTGSIKAVEDLIKQLTPEMDAAFFIVHHVSRKGVGNVFFYRLQHHAKIPCKLAEDNMPIERGVIYIAPPDQHLLIANGCILLRKSARENRWRPSINNMFRSAAAHYNSRVIGIVLSGLLDDGTSGMATIKRSGGITIVQDPNEADHPDMPLSIIDNIEVSHVESLSKMGELLSHIMASTKPREIKVPYDVIVESRIDEKISTRIEDLAQFEKSHFNCPECGAGLYITQQEHPTHLRCHIGHSYTERELMLRYAEVLEINFSRCLRIMEEQRTLFLRLNQKEKDRGRESIAARFLKKAQEMEVQINNMKQIINISTDVE